MHRYFTNPGCANNFICGGYCFQYAPDNADDLHHTATSDTSPQAEIADKDVTNALGDGMLEDMETN